MACFPQPCRGVQSLGEKATVRVRAGIWKEPEKCRRFVVLTRSISLLRRRGSQPLQSGQAPWTHHPLFKGKSSSSPFASKINYSKSNNSKHSPCSYYLSSSAASTFTHFCTWPSHHLKVNVYMCYYSHFTNKETEVQRWANLFEVTPLVSWWAGIGAKAAWSFCTQGHISVWTKIIALFRRNQELSIRREGSPWNAKPKDLKRYQTRKSSSSSWNFHSASCIPLQLWKPAAC